MNMNINKMEVAHLSCHAECGQTHYWELFRNIPLPKREAPILTEFQLENGTFHKSLMNINMLNHSVLFTLYTVASFRQEDDLM